MVGTTLIDRRPSALPGACPSILSEQRSVAARAHVLGIPAVTGTVRAEWIFAERSRALPAIRLARSAKLPVKINNYIGTPAAAAAVGTAVSGLVPASALVQSQQVNADMVKGIDARGIPPRGRRKV
jgi:hypothetical protein